MSTLTTQQVVDMLGLPGLTGKFLEELGFTPIERQRRALFWAERDYEPMCDAIAEYVRKRKTQTRPKTPGLKITVTPRKKSDFVSLRNPKPTATDEDEQL